MTDTSFTNDELLVITRALNIYARHIAPNDDHECVLALDIATRIYRENFYRENFLIRTENETPDIYGTPLTPDPDRLIVCRNCGSAVADMEIHRQWHIRLGH